MKWFPKKCRVCAFQKDIGEELSIAYVLWITPSYTYYKDKDLCVKHLESKRAEETRIKEGTRSAWERLFHPYKGER